MIDKPSDEELKEFWERCLQTKVEMREGFYDECGDFTDMQENPYSSPHNIKALCYLFEARELSEKDKKTYEEEFRNGIAKFIPTTSDWWQEVPEIDLNSLFKFAVPLLDGYMMFTGEGGVHFIATKNGKNYEFVADKEKDAIYGAVWEAIHER